MIALLLACGGPGADSSGTTEGLTDLSLGSSVTDTGGLTEPFSFEVPGEASSVAIACGPWSDDLLGTTWELTDPNGTVIYANSISENHDPSARMRVGNHDDFLPFLFPVSPDLDLTAGTYTMSVWVAAGGSPVDVSCDAVMRTDAVQSTATVDLHVVLVGTPLTAATAADDADWSAVLDTVGTLWDSGGVSVGDVTYEDFSGDTTRFSVVDITDTDASELNALLRTSQPPSRRSMTIFLVEEISAAGATVLGLAAGPPGAATIHGTSKSGMVVGTLDLGSDNDMVARIIAHEGGHFLGLFHTSEKDGGNHDPLSDTPQCTSSDDTNSDGVLAPSECSSKGSTNLMWWSENDDARSLSTDQSWVLRRNPVAR